MTRTGIATTLLLFVLTASAQGNLGTITGTIKGPDGSAVTGATLQAKNVMSGTVYKTDSTRTGSFTFVRLPVGTYEILVPTIGFTYLPFTKKDVVVKSGQPAAVDIRLEWAFNLGTLGDDTYLTIRNRYKNVGGPAPRMPNGKPDFSGTWNGSGDPNQQAPTPLPWADAIAKERLANNLKDSPSAYCLPGEMFPSSPLIYKFIQTSSLFVQLTEDEPAYRQIFLDGRSHPKDPDPTWKGHSVAKWDGDTLVVDTIGFNEKGWLPENLPHTEKLRIVERYRRPDLAHLKIDVTIDDPGTLSKPWNIHMTWELAPGEELIEYVCPENNQYRVK
jgi:hypothetical protein